MNNEFGQAYSRHSQEAAAERGLEIVAEETVDPTDSGAPSGQMTNLVEAAPDAILAVPLGAQCIAFMTELGNAKAANPDFAPAVYQTATCANPLFFQATTNGGADGVYTSSNVKFVDRPGVRRRAGVQTFLEAMATYAPDTNSADLNALAGWLSMELAVHVAEQAFEAGDYSRAGIINAARNIDYVSPLAMPGGVGQMNAEDAYYAEATGLVSGRMRRRASSASATSSTTTVRSGPTRPEPNSDQRFLPRAQAPADSETLRAGGRCRVRAQAPSGRRATLTSYSLDPVITISNSQAAPVVSVAVQANVVPSSWSAGSAQVALVKRSSVSGRSAARSSSFCSMNSSASLRKSAAVVKHPATPAAAQRAPRRSRVTGSTDGCHGDACPDGSAAPATLGGARFAAMILCDERTARMATSAHRCGAGRRSRGSELCDGFSNAGRRWVATRSHITTRAQPRRRRNRRDGRPARARRRAASPVRS